LKGLAMKAKIVGGEFDGVEFDVSIETQEKIEEKMDKYYDVKEYCRMNRVYHNVPFAKFVPAEGNDSYNYVQVPLPNCNNGWTFAAFDWVKTFCEHFSKKYNPWPEHRSHLNCADYLWIKV